MFSSFGLCAPHSGTMNYELPAVYSYPPHILSLETDTLIPYVAEIAEINVNTWDGNNKINIMDTI